MDGFLRALKFTMSKLDTSIVGSQKKLFFLPVIMTLRCGKAHLKIKTWFIVFVFATEIA